MKQKRLNEILEKHEKWLHHEEGGKQAVFNGVNLSNLTFTEKNVSSAVFNKCDFSHSKFYYSDCSYSDFSNCIFDHTEIRCSNFNWASFTDNTILRNCKITNWSTFLNAVFTNSILDNCEINGCDFTHSTFENSIVSVHAERSVFAETIFSSSGINKIASSFINSDFYRAKFLYTNFVRSGFWSCTFRETEFYCSNFNFSVFDRSRFKYCIINHSCFTSAHLRSADMDIYSCKISDDGSGLYLACPEVGSFIGWKTAGGKIVKLKITEDALRSSSTGRKCRCSKAEVLAIEEMDGGKADISKVVSGADPTFFYEVGKIVEVKNFNKNRWAECTNGIHFFITRQEAVNYIDG